jgi:hypothetical protein
MSYRDGEDVMAKSWTGMTLAEKVERLREERNGRLQE